MKKTLLVTTLLCLLPTLATAKDAIGNYSIAEALNQPVAQSKLGQDVAFYFGDQAHGKVTQEMGVFKTNKKTNAFNKTDTEACQWVFLSAMLALKERALKEGGNAVVEIQSNYKNHLTSSQETFQCGAGTLMAGVALSGKVVKLAK